MLYGFVLHRHNIISLSVFTNSGCPGAFVRGHSHSSAPRRCVYANEKVTNDKGRRKVFYTRNDTILLPNISFYFFLFSFILNKIQFRRLSQSILQSGMLVRSTIFYYIF